MFSKDEMAGRRKKKQLSNQQRARAMAMKRKDPAYREKEKAARREKAARIKANVKKETESQNSEDSVSGSLPETSQSLELSNDEQGSVDSSGKDSKMYLKQLRARERMARKRADPEYASKERERARLAKARKREDPVFLEFERAKNRQMMALKRQDPEYASRERERARQIMALRRKNEHFAEAERVLNRQRAALKRKSPEYRQSIKNCNQVTCDVSYSNDTAFS